MPRSTINGTAIDLDGKEMILDADQDTTLTVDTDDQVDIKIAGNDQVVITTGSTAFKAPDGGNRYALNGMGNSDSAELSLYDSSDAQKVRIGAGADTFFNYGNVGIGTATPSTNFNTNRNNLVIADASSAGLTLNSTATDGSSIISMTDGTGTLAGEIHYVHDGNYMMFKTSNSEALRIDSSGHLILKKNLALDMTTSDGIDFGAAGSSANTLDDYEEGTWTPTITALSSNPTITYDTLRFGYYTKIGRQVIVFGRVRTDAVSGGSGFVKIGGLPFTESGINGDNYTSGGGVVSDSFASNPPHSTMVISDSNTFYLVYGNYNLVQVSDLTNQANANQIQFSLHYITDA